MATLKIRISQRHTLTRIISEYPTPRSPLLPLVDLQANVAVLLDDKINYTFLYVEIIVTEEIYFQINYFMDTLK